MFPRDPKVEVIHDPAFAEHLLSTSPRRRTMVPDLLDHLFAHEHAHGLAYYIAYIVTFFVYGVGIGAISLIVFELLLSQSDGVRIGVALTIGGILAIIVGLVIHPWMREHLPQKDA